VASTLTGQLEVRVWSLIVWGQTIAFREKLGSPENRIDFKWSKSTAQRVKMKTSRHIRATGHQSSLGVSMAG